MTGTNETKTETSEILVVGCRGMLGTDLMARLARDGLAARGMDLPDIDITRPAGLRSVMSEVEPWLVVNCAAYTAVDRAEQDVDLAFAVNRDGPANLAAACATAQVPLVHISTDYVFDGAKQSAYREDDPAAPLGVYGRSKWAGEEAIRERLPEHVIIRTAWLYGRHGPNFVSTMLRLMRRRETLKVVADQHGCPTWTGHLAAAIARVAERIRSARPSVPWGTYHYCGLDDTTWYGFAEAIAAEAGRSEPLTVKKILPITTADYPTAARRPAHSVLDCSKIRDRFGVEAQPWRPTLVQFLKDLELVQQ